MLFITDLDGTALGGDYAEYARFPDIFSTFLDSLSEHCIKWGINTTWDVNGQWDLIKLSKVKSRPAYLMAEFGLRMAATVNDQPELVQPYTANMEKQLKEFQHIKFNPMIHDISGRFKAEKVIDYGHLFCFQLAANDDFNRFNHYLEKFLNDDELICRFDGRMFVARPAFMSKASPFAEVGLPPERIIVAGDELTDLAMMQPDVAKYYICPANAAPKVKEHVLKYNGEIADQPYAAGVIQAFRRLAKRHNWYNI